MTEYLSLLKSKTKLKKVVATLSDKQISAVIANLQSILTSREQQRAESARKDAEKREKVADFLNQLKAAGITPADLTSKPTSSNKG